MNKKNFLIGFAVLAILGIAFYYVSGADLQGRFKGGGFSFTPKPNLEVTDISLSSTNELEITVENTGKADVPTGSKGHTYIYIDDMSTPAWTYSWSTLSDTSFLTAGGSSVISPQKLDSDEYEVMACVDAKEVVTERDETDNCMTVTLNEIVASEDLLVSIDADRPNEDIILAGADYVLMNVGSISNESEESYIVKEFTVLNHYDSTPGDKDDAVAAVIISYKNSDGDDEVADAYIVDGEALLTDLDILVEPAESVEVWIYADINGIGGIGGSGATSGDTIKLYPSNSGIYAVGQESGKVVRKANYDDDDNADVSPTMYVHGTKLSIDLASSSPSGSRTVNTEDEVIDIELTADSAGDVEITDLLYYLSTDSDLNTSASVTGELYYGSTVVGSSTVKVLSVDEATVSFTDDFTVPAGETRTYTLVVDTDDLLDEDAGVDDPFTVKIELGSASDGAVSSGSIKWNDGYIDVQWLGDVDSSTFTGNTLNY